MSRTAWYWHRLRAMDPAEMIQRVYKGLFPTTPPVHQISFEHSCEIPIRHVAADIKQIMAGEWKLFGKIPVQVDDPPRWNYDYLAGVEISHAGKSDHRELPKGADARVIWELNRWRQVVQLAHGGGAKKCLAWLEDWVAKNPPYQGVNWTSALESGIRLIHLTQIDSLLGGVGTLRDKILPSHVWFTWKERSFGSSANNHLLGELAGLILASARWPQMQTLCAPMDRLQRAWEREVLSQFAEDGGNREQALSYHAFSLDLCNKTRDALTAAERKISPAVEQRLNLAEEFYDLVQVPGEQWDYGDSDDAVQRTTSRWPEPDRWHYFPQTGIARYRASDWDLRWDLSPLGYLSTAAHGHLDALHLSLWWKGMAMVIDPGTGAYYSDPKLRAALAGWDAHNGPHLPGQDYPKRLGPFLWSEHHATPTWSDGCGKFKIREGMFTRKLIQLREPPAWQIHDMFEPYRPFIVRWQFAPGAEIRQTDMQTWRLKRQDAQFDIQVSGGVGESGIGAVSPGFRQTTKAPFLELKTGSEACVLRTIFLSC
ncbi:MAG TPA: heparinase II/III family protein [Verrucomicrobiae bacterium]|nr:heparinase II/III family protein [Verrucomicrobiae bacterium]